MERLITTSTTDKTVLQGYVDQELPYLLRCTYDFTSSRPDIDPLVNMTTWCRSKLGEAMISHEAWPTQYNINLDHHWNWSGRARNSFQFRTLQQAFLAQLSNIGFAEVLDIRDT